MLGIRNSTLQQLELGLLFAFDAIYSERNVTRAASRLGIGQPAMSHSLSRLRTIFADELFVRAPGGVQPTPRAIGLHAPIQEALAAVWRVAEPFRRFDPLRDVRTFRVVVSDDLEMSIIPLLLAELASVSNRLTLETVSANSGGDLDMIDLAEVDLAIGIFPDGGLQHKRRVICDMEPYNVLFDPRTTGLQAPLLLEDYVRLPHVVIESRTVLNRRIDKLLADTGRRRDIALRTPHALVVPFMLKQSPLIATVPRRTAVTLAPYFGLQAAELPIAMPLESILLIWHKSHSGDPANLWLRQRIDAVVRQILDDDPAAGHLPTTLGTGSD